MSDSSTPDGRTGSTRDAEPGTKPDIDDLVDQLKARVEERRQQGVYPPGLEDELEQHFRRIAGHRVIPDYTGLAHAIALLEQKASFNADLISTASSAPGGSLLHRTLAKMQRRQTDGILAQVQEFAEATRDALRAVLALMEQPAGHRHPELMGEIDAILDRMATFERTNGTPAEPT
jgi:hypothetical protein